MRTFHREKLSRRLSVAHLTNPFLLFCLHPSQLCRTVPRARTETNGARSSTTKTSYENSCFFVWILCKFNFSVIFLSNYHDVWACLLLSVIGHLAHLWFMLLCSINQSNVYVWSNTLQSGQTNKLLPQWNSLTGRSVFLVTSSESELSMDSCVYE